MESQFNKLTPSEAERLFLLLEEMGEAQQVIGKILRHGYDSHHPENDHETNRNLLEKEIGDVIAALNLMRRAQDISWGNVMDKERLKQINLRQYLHHSQPMPPIYSDPLKEPTP